MNNTRFYKIIILILVLLNLGTLTFLVVHHPRFSPERMRGRSPDLLTRELMLDPRQQDEFGKLRYKHRERMFDLQEKDRKLHDRFFEVLFQPTPDTIAMRSLADSISEVRKQMELLTFEHFLRLRQLLNPDQQGKFHRVFKQALEHIMPLPAPPPHRFRR